MHHYKYSVTVFTAVFNRAHTLERLYRSLQQQTFKDFEWLIIDDGSTDGSRELIENWMKERNSFPIRYYHKENGGKHTAINMGLDKSQGELFFTVDSDDYLTADALEQIDAWIKALPQDGKYCGVVGNMGTSKNETPNTVFKEKWKDATLLERYTDMSKQPLDGERAYVFFTVIHQKYKYPVFENEKFITEAVAWNRMANDGYKMRFYNDIIYIYKYLPNGLTLSGNKMFTENPKGYGLWLKEKAQYSHYSTAKKFKMIYSFFISQKDRISKATIAENIGTNLPVIYIVNLLTLLKGFHNKFR